MKNKILILMLAIAMLITPFSRVTKAESKVKPVADIDSNCVIQQMSNELSMLVCYIDSMNYEKNVEMRADNYTEPKKNVKLHVKLNKGSSLQDEFKFIDYTDGGTLTSLSSKNVGGYEYKIEKNDNRELVVNITNFGKASVFSNGFVVEDTKLINDDYDRLAFGIVYRNEELAEPITYDVEVTVDGKEVVNSQDTDPIINQLDSFAGEPIYDEYVKTLSSMAKKFNVPSLAKYDLDTITKAEESEHVGPEDEAEPLFPDAEETDTTEKEEEKTTSPEETENKDEEEPEEKTEDKVEDNKEEKKEVKEESSSKNYNQFIYIIFGVIIVLGIGLLLIGNRKKKKADENK